MICVNSVNYFGPSTPGLLLLDVSSKLFQFLSHFFQACEIIRQVVNEASWNQCMPITCSLPLSISLHNKQPSKTSSDIHPNSKHNIFGFTISDQTPKSGLLRIQCPTQCMTWGVTWGNVLSTNICEITLHMCCNAGSMMVNVQEEELQKSDEETVQNLLSKHELSPSHLNCRSSDVSDFSAFALSSVSSLTLASLAFNCPGRVRTF